MSAPEPLLQIISECSSAHRRLLDHVAEMDDADMSRPSLLPAWTVGHVLTHLARNADAFTGIFRAAAGGGVAEMYAGGSETRAAAIERGAGRPAAEILDDLRLSTAAYEATVNEAPAAAWAGHGLNMSGRAIPCLSIPVARWREVEVHRVDLGLGYSPEQWPEAFVEAQLADAVAQLPDRLTRPEDRSTMLGWLWGRLPSPADIELGPWEASRRPPDR
ncbi:MAG: maleylpyruvate isomerase family mycothiol-dependent enzyme [Actinomycetota bacterium]|nr:maleylpyruvate isomerase family mycothiol-dependent enzyme [Actinomycetota bacterium]